MMRLEKLPLTENRITRLKPVAGLNGLKTLDPYRTPNLTRAEIARLQQAFPKREINHNARN